MSRLCTICAKPDSRRCAKCKSTAYCSIECQQTDWPLHSLLCKSLGSFLTPPTLTSRLAIFFPWNEPHPRFIWVEVQLSDPSRIGESGGSDYADVTELLKNHPGEGTRGFGPHREFLRGNLLRGRAVNRNTIEFIERESYIQDDTRSNKSINSVQGHGWKSWIGSIVVMVRNGNDRDPLTYGHVTLEGFRDATDYMAWYRDGIGSVTDGIGSRTHFAERIMEGKAGKVKGVRVSCQGDIALLGAEKLISVDVPRTHPLFNIEGDDPSPLSYLLDYAVCAKRYPVRLELKGLDADENLANPMVSALYAKLEDSGEAFGKTQKQWQGKVGSVLFVDRRGGDLLPSTLLHMFNFLESEISPLLAEYLRRGGQTVGRENILEAVTPKRFQQYLDHITAETVIG
ncbi:MAG: hypothetical protein M1813_000702 [Trichoglossum hirsutum]|nr:MAG: hypothetical protein M1813_000702 [Trichoglossum hirsutum]